MAQIYPTWTNINRLRVIPEAGERYLLEYLENNLDDSFEIYFNPYLDGDRPDLIVLKKDYGAVVIEVKDWNLVSYSVDGQNNWYTGSDKIRSPQKQAFRYKTNLYELHLPVLGIKEISNKNFYGVVEVYVYFHKASQRELNVLYDRAHGEASSACKKINNERHELSHDQYTKRMDYWEGKKKQINRDKAISICRDTLEGKLQKIRQLRKNVLFTEEIYIDFKRRLQPPTHITNQGAPISFDSKQLNLTESNSEFSKVKGVAGCGKTTILAQRALNARDRHGGNVLILTYNITVRHYIKDTLSRISGRQVPNEFEVVHYHGFISAKMNEHGIDLKSQLDRFKGSEQQRIEKVYASPDLFANVETEKYKSIFIDEVQDYEPSWIKIIRDNFLDTDGEMVLFGDQSQNIYQREEGQRESAIVQGFGRWKKLSKSYRSSMETPLIALFSAFQKEFLIPKYADSDVFESAPTQDGLSFDLLAYECSSAKRDLRKILETIQQHIKSHDLHPNDVVIVASEVEPLFAINSELENIEKTKVMFETQEEVSALPANPKDRASEIEKIRRRKKTFFFQNSGLIKLSTVHSFKGLEAEAAFFLILPSDTPEIVYTGITRAKKHLAIFDVEGSQFNRFFKSEFGIKE